MNMETSPNQEYLSAEKICPRCGNTMPDGRTSRLCASCDGTPDKTPNNKKSLKYQSNQDIPLFLTSNSPRVGRETPRQIRDRIRGKNTKHR
jgi:hypothetical protein